MKSGAGQRFVRDADVVGATTSGAQILLNSRTWNYLSLDEIGARIWALLECPTPLPELVNRLVAEYAVDAAVCRADTEEFLRDLAEKGFVVSAPA